MASYPRSKDSLKENLVSATIVLLVAEVVGLIIVLCYNSKDELASAFIAFGYAQIFYLLVYCLFIFLGGVRVNSNNSMLDVPVIEENENSYLIHDPSKKKPTVVEKSNIESVTSIPQWDRLFHKKKTVTQNGSIAFKLKSGKTVYADNVEDVAKACTEISLGILLPEEPMEK